MKGFLLWLLLGLVCFCQCEWDTYCRGGCDCKWGNGKKVANCTMGGLTTIPPDLHSEVQVLILDYNHIIQLGEKIFITRLPNLQKIFMQHCGIQTIHESAFNDLKILVEIDLSNNNISKFGTNTFSGNSRLKTLNLSNNPIKQLDAYQFPALPHLKNIDFSNCFLTTIHRTTFGHLGNSVESILLKSNSLTSLQEDIFLSLTNLKSLELHQNPWKCDCHLKQFRDWVVEANLLSNPTTCTEPERLSGKEWKTVESQEFACKPEIEVSKGTIYSQPGSNVTLSCFITGNPVPEAKWVLRGRIVTNNTSPLHGSNNQIYVIHELGGFERWFNLTLMNISEDDADDYTCVGVNAGGVSEQNVSLTFNQPKISPDTHEPVETNQHFTVIIGAAAAGGLLVTMLCFIYCCCRCKKCQKHSEGSERHSRHGQAYGGSIVGFSNSDQQSLIEPRGILKHRENSHPSSGRVEMCEGPRPLSQMSGKRSLDSNHTVISQASLHTLPDGVQYPDLLDIPNRDQQVSPTGNGTTIPPQMLNASSLLPPEVTCTCPNMELPPASNKKCDLPFFDRVGIATAAILPPPPSFLSSGETGGGHCQVQTVALNKHPSSAFVTLPRNGRKTTLATNNSEVRLVPFYDGVGLRTSANGSSEAGRRLSADEEMPPVPPPAMFNSGTVRGSKNSSDSEEKANKLVNFGCAECEGEAEQERLKSLLKLRKGKTKGGENKKETSQEVWKTDPSLTMKNSYSTLPNIRGNKKLVSSREDGETNQGSKV